MAEPLPFLSLAQEIADRYAVPPPAAHPPPPAPKLGFFGNLARGAKLGAMVDVPTMVGQALEAPGRPGDTLYDVGKGLVDAAKARGAQPGYESDPDSLVQAGARTLPTILGLTAAGAAATAAAPEALAVGAGAAVTGALGGALFGGSQFQETFDKAKAAGATDDEAHAAALKAGGVAGVAGSVGPALAGRFIRGVGGPLATRVFGARTAADVTSEFTNPRLLKPLLLGTAEQAVAQPALMAGQAAGIAAIEQGAGVQGPTPLEAAKSSVLPTLSMVALSAPFAAMGIGLSNRARRNIADTATTPSVPPDARTRAVLTIGREMTKVDPNVAADWQLSALEAIQRGQPIEIHPDFAENWQTTRAALDANAALEKAAATPPLLEKPAIPLSTGMVPNEEERAASAAADAHANAVYSAREEYEKRQGAIRPTNVPPEEAPTGEPPPIQTVAERAGVQDLTPGGVAPTTDTAMGHAFRAAQLDAAFKQREAELAAKKESEMLSLQIAGQFTRQAERNVAAGEKLATAAEERPGLTTINTPADPDIAVATMRRLVDEAGVGKIQPGVYRQVVEALQQKSRQAQMTALDELPSHKNEKTKSFAAIDLLLKYMRGEDETARATETAQAAEPGKAAEPIVTAQSAASEIANAEPTRPESKPAASEATAATAEVARTRPEGNGPAFRAAGEGEESGRDLAEKFGEDALGPEEFRTVSDKFAGDEGDAALSAQLPNKPSLFYHEDHPFRRDLPIGDADNRQFLLHYAEARWFLGNAEGVPEIKRLAAAMNFIPPEHITERIRNAALESFRGWTPEDHARFTKLLATYVRSIELAERMGDVAGAKEKAAKEQLNYQLKQEREAAAASRAAALAKGMRRGLYGLQPDLEFMGHIANNGGSAQAALEFIANRHSDSTVRSIARALYDLNLGTTIERSADDSLIGAVFIPEENRALIGRGGDNGVTVMHELVHSASHAALERGLINIAALESGSKTEADLSLREMAEVEATRLVQRLFDDYRKGIFLKDTPAALAASNVHDFVAESLSNPDIQEILGARGWGLRLWQRFVDVIHRWLGRPQIGDTPFEQLLQVVPTLFGKPNTTSPGVFFSPIKRSLDGYLMGTAKGIFGPDSYGWFSRTTMLHQQEVLRSRIADLAQKYPTLAPAMTEVLKGFNGFYERIRDRAGYHTALTSEFKPLGQDRLTLQNTNLKAFEKLTNMMVEASRIGIDPRRSFQDVVDAEAKRKGTVLTASEIANLRRVHGTPYADKLRADYQELKQISAAMEARAHGKPIVTPLSLYEKEVVNSQALHLRPMANYVTALIRSFGSNDARFADVLRRLDTWALMKRATDQRLTLGQQVGELGRAIRDADALVTQHREAVLGQIVKRFGSPQKEVKGEKIDVVNPNVDDYINFLKKQTGNTDELQATVRAADNLRQSITDLHSRYAGQLDVPYFHLGRAGEYMIHFRVADEAEGSTANWDRVMGVVGGDFGRGGLGQGVGPPLRGNRDVYLRFRDEEQHAEAEKLLVPLRNAGLMKKSTGEVSWASGKMDMKEWGADTATPLFVHKLKESIDSLTSLSAEQRQDMKDTIQQQYLASLPSTMSKPSMVRDGDLGYSTDFINTGADRQTVGHAMIAGTYSQPLMNEQVNRVDNAMRDLRESTVVGASEAQKEMAKFHEELKRRVQLLQHIPASPNIDKIRALTAGWYLAMSPAYLVMNAYQPWQVTMPYLGAKYGFVDSAKSMAKNAALAFAIVHKAMKMNWLEEPSGTGAKGVARKLDSISSMTLPFADMKDGKGRQLIENGKLQALEDLQWSGLLSFGLTNQIARMNAEDQGAIAKATRVASIFSHYVEVTNRLTTMLTAYDLARNPSAWAKQRGTAAMDHEGAVQYARFMVRSTDMDHSQANVARGLGRQGVLGKATPLAVGFQQYDFQMVELLARTIARSFSKNAGEAREARRAIAGVSLMTAAMAGTLGLPFVGVFSALANSLASAGGALGLTNDKDDPFDAQQWFRKTSADMFGKEMGEVISRGIPRAFGIDMSTRSGFQDLIPFTQFFSDRAKIADQVTNGALDTLGPAVGTAAGFLEAAHAAYEGDYPRMIQNGLPVGLRNWAKAYWLAAHGFEAGGLGHAPIPIGENFTNQANPWQILMQAGGFTPAAKAEYTEKSQGFNTRQQLIEHRREVITSQIYKAYEAQDWSRLGSLWSDLIEFNLHNPVQPIQAQSLAQGIKGRKEKAVTGAVSGTGVLATRQQLPLLQPFSY